MPYYDSELDELTSWLLRLERIVDESSNMVVITDANRRITWINKKYTEVTGWTLDEVRGSLAGKILQGTDPRTVARVGEALTAGQSVSCVELINYRKSREPYTAMLNIEPIRDDAGNTQAFFSIQSDVSETRSLEIERDRLQRQLQHAQQMAGLGRLEFDRLTGGIQWSTEVNTILELDPSINQGRFTFLKKFVSPEAQKEVHRSIHRSMTDGEPFDSEIPVITTKGRNRWVRCKAIPQHQHDSSTTLTVLDVTVYKELIELQQQSNDKLQKAVNKRTRSLEEAYKSLESFSHALSHDIKKPIRHVVSYGELVNEKIASGDLQAAMGYSEKVIAAGRRMCSIVDSMFALSRFGRRGIDLSAVDMKRLLSDCLSEVSASFPGRDYTADGIDACQSVIADPILIYEIWRNLLENAFKYSSMREHISLQFECKGSLDGWTMSLRDNGCGFNASQKERIFGLFERASPDTSIGGDGIGLALCHRIAQAHGGKIWAESHPQGGATFHIFLPRGLPSQTRPHAE